VKFFFKKTYPDSRGFLFLIILYTVLPPLAIDTYTPAIPTIASYFQVSPSDIIATVTTYMLGYALGILLWGPLSDKFGRKKILVTGIVLFIISTFICSFSTTFYELTASRFIQGFGDAACTTVAYAMVRDCFSGKELTKILASLIMIFMIAPIAAPFIGLGIVKFIGEWQYIFHFLTLYGFIAFIFTFKVPETNKKNNEVSLSESFKAYISHLHNKTFIFLLTAIAFGAGTFFIFIGSAAVAYMKTFGVSETAFVILFALNTISVLLANYTLKKITDRIEGKYIILSTSCASFLLAFTAFILNYLNASSIISFFLFMFLITFCLAMCMTSITSYSYNSIKHAFGAGSSMASTIRFTSGGLVLLFISNLEYKNMGYSLFLIQTCLLFVMLLVVLYCNRLKYF